MCCKVVNAGSVNVSMFGQLDSPFDNMFYDDVLVISRTFDSVTMTGPFHAEMIPHLPNSVRFICHNGTGFDQIDIAACTARGIGV
jgi:lactate dehydrogenase-like 2-hydroxyacid dehydrogenase